MSQKFLSRRNRQEFQGATDPHQVGGLCDGLAMEQDLGCEPQGERHQHRKLHLGAPARVKWGERRGCTRTISAMPGTLEGVTTASGLHVQLSPCHVGPTCTERVHQPVPTELPAPQGRLPSVPGLSPGPLLATRDNRCFPIWPEASLPP